MLNWLPQKERKWSLQTLNSTLSHLFHFVCIHQQTSDKDVFLLFRIPETSQWGRKKKQKPAGTDTAETLRRLSRTPSRSELECDEDFLGTTGRREVQLAHKQETAEATNTMGFPVYPPPYRIISHFTHSHLCLSSRVLLLILPSQVAPPHPPTHPPSSSTTACFS